MLQRGQGLGWRNQQEGETLENALHLVERKFEGYKRVENKPFEQSFSVYGSQHLGLHIRYLQYNL